MLMLIGREVVSEMLAGCMAKALASLVGSIKSGCWLHFVCRHCKMSWRCLASKSFQNEEMLLNVPFSAEEVSATVAKLKNRMTAGQMAEHFKEGGESVVILLMNVQNAVV